MASATLAWNEPTPESWRGGAVTIGNFDGVHLGHTSLLKESQRQAATVGGPAVAVTFDPHPLQLLRPAQFQPVLTTLADRVELLQARGADHVVVLRTTPELLQLSANAFFAQVVQQRLRARALVEGVNFGFGHNREGTVDTLKQLCRQAGLILVVVPAVGKNGVIVSSSRVRDALVRGDVRAAAGLLERPYRLSGLVGTGQQRGRTLGFPTANLTQMETLIPADGVYAVRVSHAGTSWPGAANVGPNPTFGEQTRKVEVHLIGFEGDLLGQRLAIDFIDRLRDTQTFSGPGQLIEQLRTDVDQARRIISGST